MDQIERICRQIVMHDVVVQNRKIGVRQFIKKKHLKVSGSDVPCGADFFAEPASNRTGAATNF